MAPAEPVEEEIEVVLPPFGQGGTRARIKKYGSKLISSGRQSASGTEGGSFSVGRTASRTRHVKGVSQSLSNLIFLGNGNRKEVSPRKHLCFRPEPCAANLRPLAAMHA